VPTTPNPTSGYFIIVPRARVRDLDMSVEEALKYVVSMGVVMPRGSTVPPRVGVGVREPPRPSSVAAPSARN